MVRFRHLDAVENPKPNRPGAVDTVHGGRVSLFYGSTCKAGGYPVDVIVADRDAPIGTPERDLGDRLAGAIDERTLFHGTMMSETPCDDPHVRPMHGVRCPNAVISILQAQATARVIEFVAAWNRLRWINPQARTWLLDALWWRVEFDGETELLLTLVLSDGWSLPQVAALRWIDLDAHGYSATVCGERLGLLPRTRGLLELHRKARGDSTPWSSHDLDVLRTKIEAAWKQLAVCISNTPRQQRRPGKRNNGAVPQRPPVLPRWEEVLRRIDPQFVQPETT